MPCRSGIALVSCVKSKQSHATRAGDLYTSALFTKMRKYAQLNASDWYILSAKHGLLHPDTVVEPYELTLNTCGSKERKAWAYLVRDQIHELGLLNSKPSLLWLAGQMYIQHLRPLLTGCEHIEPMHGMGIGVRLKWLTEQITQ